MIHARQLERLYQSYGFSVHKVPGNPPFRVFLYGHGEYFNNAEVVLLEQTDEFDRVCTELEEAGYSYRVKYYESFDEAREELFKGFFGADGVREQLRTAYERFVTQQSDYLQAPYEYVHVPYRALRPYPGSYETVVDALASALTEPGPRLVILEAAAGYGKTCTAFEVLRRLLDIAQDKVPLLTELSRNRGAREFRYVLLDEIDRNFSHLPSTLVTKEIQNGRIPLIVDGFDELLDRSVRENRFDEIEPMLDTLAGLLRQDAKAIVTTRRTAIFASSDFHTWADREGADFSICRYVLSEPEVEHWLGHERRHLLEDAGIPLRQLSNPVLLAFLRAANDSDFSELVETPEEIVQNYFERLLRREQVRQSLKMEPDEQKAVFYSVVRDMVEQDYDSATPEEIRELIATNNLELLEKVRQRYIGEEVLQVEELVDKLTVHAFLNRPGADTEAVGFVNDFVLGSLVGDIICADAQPKIARDDIVEAEEPESGDGNQKPKETSGGASPAAAQEESEWLGPEQFVDKAVTAYGARAQSERTRIHQLLMFAFHFFEPQKVLQWELILRGKSTRNYNGATFSGLTLTNSDLGAHGRFENCVFADCRFHGVKFHLGAFINTGFAQCEFYDCRSTGDVVEGHGRWIVAPSGDVDFAERLQETPTAFTEENSPDYERHILERFWPIGKQHFERTRALNTLFMGRPSNEKPAIRKALDQLCKRGLVEVQGTTAFLNTDKLAEIREKLDREGGHDHC